MTGTKEENLPAECRHIACFVYGLAGSGAQWRMVQLANSFAARGHRVDLVVVRAHGPLRQELSPFVRLIPLGPWWEGIPFVKKRTGRWWLIGLCGLVRYLWRERPDVLLSTSYFSNIIALWARVFTQMPTRVVVRVSNHLSHSAVHVPTRARRLGVWCARRFYPLADAIIAVSKGIVEDVACVTGVPQEQITAIPNPILTVQFPEKAGEPLDHPWFAPNSPPVLLGTGRLAKQKDFSTLLKAFARVRAVRPARLIILGEGRKRKQLEALAWELGVVADVAMPGFLLNPFPYMMRASVFVLSSRWEGLPGVVVEALACGCPVVSTDCPSGPAEVLEGGVYGPLVSVGDDAALAQAILTVLDRPPDPTRLRARASLFSVDQAVDRYLEVLLGGIEKSRDRSSGIFLEQKYRHPLKPRPLEDEI